VEKNTAIHTALAGILAIDSCVKCIDKEEAFIIGNMIRGAGAAIGQFRALERELGRVDAGWRECCVRLGDGLKYLVRQMYCIPAARGREDDQERQLALLEKDQTEISEDEFQADYQKLLSELQRENELLKVGIKEKEAYICSLENRCERNLPKF
jgi:predicted RNase H-like nuclease (RuvC/YqgF family)